MHKKLEAELVSLANSILEMKNNEELAALHKKAQEVYEKLTVLKFVESNLNGMVSEKEDVIETIEEKPIAVEENLVEETKQEEPVVELVEEKIETVEEIPKEEVFENKSEEVTKEEISEEVELNPTFEEEISEDKPVEIILEETIEKDEVVELPEEELEDLFSIQDELVKNDVEEIPSIQHTLEEEFENAISADVATNLFERVTKNEPIIEETIEEVEERIEEKKVSLNDSIFKDNIQVGLNDRIAFVKYLFDGSQEDFNRVLSQLNSFDTEKEAKSFLNKLVKPDYNWTNKEEYEERLINLIERKFL